MKGKSWEKSLKPSLPIWRLILDKSPSLRILRQKIHWKGFLEHISSRGSSIDLIHLFSQLIRLNISTRDVHSFLMAQARLRKTLNPPMSKAAMKVKLNNAAAYACKLNNEISKLKRALLKATGKKRCKQKRIIMRIRNKILKIKLTIWANHNKAGLSKYL